MNNLSPSWFPAGAIAALALGCVLPVELWAGEAIQFSNARTRQDPTAKSKLPGLEKGDGLGRVSPLDYVPSGVESSRRDPAKERKDKNAAAERANWMILNRGELDAQDKEKSAFGIRPDSSEKEPDRRDYFFTPLNEKDDQPGRPRPLFARPPGRDRNQAGAASKEGPTPAGQGEGNSDARRSAVLGKNGQPLGDHTSKELDLKDLLSSGKANSLAPAGDKTSQMWKEVLGGSSDSGSAFSRRRDESSTADSFRGSVSSGAQRPGDSSSFRNDFNSRAATPGSFSGAESASSASRSFSPPTAPIAPRAADPGLGRTPGAYGPSAASDPYSSRPGNSAVDPYAGYRSPAQPARAPSGSYQIPSRPGYGGR